MKSVAFVILGCVLLQFVSGGLRPYPVLAPRTEEVSSRCRRQSESYLRALNNFTLWAVQMYDASAKLPTGVLEANAYEFGHFDECLRVDGDLGLIEGIHDRVLGQYCLITFHLGTNEPYFPPKIDIDFDPLDSAWKKVKPSGDKTQWRKNRQFWGACVPAACSPQDVRIGTEALLAELEIRDYITFELDPSLCQTKQTLESEKAFSFIDIFVFALMSVLILLVLISTTYDLFLRWVGVDSTRGTKEYLLQCFSAAENAPKLISSTSSGSSFDALTGFRTTQTLLVLFGHRLRLYLQGPLYTSLTFEIRARGFSFLTTSLIVVNSFFAVTGLLTGYFFSLELEKRDKFSNIFPPLIYRILRMFPLYIVVILLNLSILKRLHDGPLWPLIGKAELQRCEENWWTNLLFINNYVNANKMCMFQSWYLSADLQLFVLALVLLWITKKFWKLGYALFASLISFSIGYHFYLLYINEAEPYLFVKETRMRDIPDDEYFTTYYVPSEFRIAPFLISVALGHYLSLLRVPSSSTESNTPEFVPPSIPEPYYGFICLVILGALMVVQNIGHIFSMPGELGPMVKALYGSTANSLWALGMALVHFMNIRKQIGWFQYFYTLKIWIFLSKLCFCAYFIHTFHLIFEFGGIRLPKYTTRYEEYWMYTGDVFYTFLFSFYLCLIVEVPFSRLLKFIVLGKRNDQPLKRKSESSETDEMKKSD